MSLYTDPEEMRAFFERERTGHLPDEQFYLTEEDDPTDPEQREILAMVVDNYAATNRRRREERDQARIGILEALLTQNGIDIPEEY